MVPTQSSRDRDASSLLRKRKSFSVAARHRELSEMLNTSDSGGGAAASPQHHSPTSKHVPDSGCMIVIMATFGTDWLDFKIKY